MQELVIASHNKGKVKEIEELLENHDIKVFSATDMGLPEPVEDGSTFIANAEIKSKSGLVHCGKACLADDSGIVIPALDGAPGIYSARWGGKEKDFNKAMQLVHDKIVERGLQPTGQSAYFICVLSLALPNGQVHNFEGRVDGSLVFPPRGSNGFGYDPIFIPNGGTKTYGQLSQIEKNQTNHRGIAFRKFEEFLADRAI